MQLNKDFALSASILPVPFHQLKDKLLELEGKVDALHLDVMDGNFVPNLTYGPPVIKQLRQLTDMYFDTHLMITNPEQYLESYREAGCNHLTFHIEVVDDVAGVIKKIHDLGMSAGIAINPKTNFSAIKPYIADADKILVMTVEPGFSGQKFIESEVPKIREISEYIKNNGLDTKISIDGGVNLDTIKLLSGIWFDELVAASYLFNGDLDRNIEAIRA